MASCAWAALQVIASLIEDACRLLLLLNMSHRQHLVLETLTVWLQVWFSTMAESYEKAFDMYVGVSDPQKLNSFWTAQLQGSPYLGGRPELLQQIQQGSRPLPMALHGDGVSVTGLGKTWQKGIDAYSISSILTFGDTGHYNQVLAMVPGEFKEHEPVPQQPFCEEVWSVLQWFGLHFPCSH